MSFGDVPSFMRPPDPSQPTGPEDWFPHVIDQRPGGDHTVLVTWALPGLRRATVRVPESAWINGEHARTGVFLAQRLPDLIGAQQNAVNPQDNDDDA